MAFAIFSRIVRALGQKRKKKRQKQKKKNKKKNVPLNSYPCPHGISIELLLLEEKNYDTIMRQSFAMMNSNAGLSWASVMFLLSFDG